MRRAAIALLLLTALWAVDAVLGEGFFLAHDLRHHHLPWRVWAAESWQAGVVPLWSADVGLGFPLMADGQTGVFYPPTMLLFMELPAHWALNLSILLHLWWAGVGATWMARGLGLERQGALLTGVAFAFSGFMSAHTGYLGMQNAAAWLPWAVGAMVHGRWAFGGLAMAMMLVAGHPQIAAIGLMLTGAVAIWQRRWRGFLGGALLALVAASPQLLATLELVEHSVREGGVDEMFANIGSLPPQELLNAALPELFGIDRPGDITQTYFHRADSYWGQGVNHWEMSFYLGLPAIVLAILGAGGRRFWLGVCGVSLLLMLGGATPLWPALRHLPGLEGFRFPVRFALALTLAVSVLAGHGLDRVLRAPDRRRWAVHVFRAAVALLVGMSLAWGGISVGESTIREALTDRFSDRSELPPTQGSAMLAAAVPRPEHISEEQVQAKADRVIAELGQSTAPWSRRVWVPVVVLLLLAGLMMRGNALGTGSLSVGIVLLLYADLWGFGANYNTRSSPDVVTRVPGALETIEASGHAGRTSVVDRRQDPALDTELISSSLGLLHGVHDVQITSPLRLVRNEALLSTVGLDIGDKGPEKWDRLRAGGGLVDMLGVRWLLSVHAIEDPNYPLRRDGPVKLYENPDAMPGAFLVGCTQPTDDAWSLLTTFNPRKQVLTERALQMPICADGSDAGTATLIRRSSTEMVITLEAKKAAMLVQTDTHYPGWTATLDGHAVDLHRVNLTFRGVEVSPGLHEVVLRYQPARILQACKAALGAMLTLILLALWRWCRR